MARAKASARSKPSTKKRGRPPKSAADGVDAFDTYPAEHVARVRFTLRAILDEWDELDRSGREARDGLESSPNDAAFALLVDHTTKTMSLGYALAKIFPRDDKASDQRLANLSWAARDFDAEIEAAGEYLVPLLRARKAVGRKGTPRYPAALFEFAAAKVWSMRQANRLDPDEPPAETWLRDAIDNRNVLDALFGERGDSNTGASRAAAALVSLATGRSLRYAKSRSSRSRKPRK